MAVVAIGLIIVWLPLIAAPVAELAGARLVAFVAAWQVQVRLVEEPYLHRVHGDAYIRYAARTGRYLPWLGRDRIRSIR